MKKSTLLLLTPLLYGTLLSPIHAAPLKKIKKPIALVATNSFAGELPYAIFEGKTWKAEHGAHFVKLHLYFDEPFEIQKIEVKACKIFDNKPRAYINFDEWSEELTPEKDTASIKLKKPLQARSLTFNFQNKGDLCLSGLNLYSKDAQILLVPPQIVAAKVSASSTLNPELAYDVMNLFDSRLEYSWSSNGKSTGESIQLDFTSAQKITKIRIWNGYQRSDTHCQANSRAKVIELAGDHNYHEKITVQDIMGGQEIVLKKPFRGKSLTLKFLEAYKGKSYADLVISELRFWDGKTWLVPDPRSEMLKVAQHNAEQFQKANLKEIYEDDLSMDIQSSEKYGHWLLRFRKDGSFYLEGSWYLGPEFANYYALGNYEIKETSKNEIKMRIFGFLRQHTGVVIMDCNGCGRDCNKPDPNGDSSEGIFQDFIIFKKTKEGITVTNAGKHKRIQFDTLFMQTQN